MAVWDTDENGRSLFTEKTLASIQETVNWSRHRLIVVDNNSCGRTKELLKHYCRMSSFEDRINFRCITLSENIGTARAINKAWQQRGDNEACVKCDNDFTVKESGWLDKLEECIAREPQIGIIALKRKDLAEWPAHMANMSNDEFLRYKSKLVPLKKTYRDLSQNWLVVERVSHAFGTVQLYSAALLERIGFLYQMGGLYSFDDSLSAVRCHVAGFWNCFYPHYEIDHIDPGNSKDTNDKCLYAAKMNPLFERVKREYLDGSRSVYHGPSDPGPNE